GAEQEAARVLQDLDHLGDVAAVTPADDAGADAVAFHQRLRLVRGQEEILALPTQRGEEAVTVSLAANDADHFPWGPVRGTMASKARGFVLEHPAGVIRKSGPCRPRRVRKRRNRPRSRRRR